MIGAICKAARKEEILQMTCQSRHFAGGEQVFRQYQFGRPVEIFLPDEHKELLTARISSRMVLGEQ